MGFLKKAGIALVISISWFRLSFAETFQGSINAPDINVRADSTANAEIICKLKKGDRVIVVQELYDWYRIRLPKSAPSYVKKGFLECLPEDTNRPPQTPIPLNEKTCYSAKVIKENVNVRLKPSEGARILGKLDKFSIVNVLGEEGAWFKIEPPENSFAWVHKRFIDKIEIKPASPELKIYKTITVNIAAEEGVVEPYGRIFNRQATHKLITADKRIFLLKGNKKSLDALNYRKVKISGKILPATKEKYPVIEITSMEALN